MIEIVLTAAGTIGIIGLCRMLLAIRSQCWYGDLHRQIDSIEPWNCARFHEIQMTPKPWMVKVNDWMEAHHV